MTNVALTSDWTSRSCFIWNGHLTNKLFARVREFKDAEALAIYSLLLSECGRQKTNTPGLTVAEMMGETGFSRRTVQRCRSLLQKIGLMKEKKPRKGGRWLGNYIELFHVANNFNDEFIHVGESFIDQRLFQTVRTIKDGYALGLYILLVDVSIMQGGSVEMRANRDWLLSESSYSKSTFQAAKKALIKLGLVIESGSKHRLTLLKR